MPPPLACIGSTAHHGGDTVSRCAAIEGEAFMSDITARLSEIVGDHNLLTGDAIPEDYFHDEVLGTPPQKPAYVAKPATAEEVSRLLKAASEHGVPVTARGSGTGLSGAAVLRGGGGGGFFRGGGAAA